MTNKSNDKLSYMSSSLVQSKVLNGGGYYLLTNLKLNNFLHEVKWIGEVYPFFVMYERRDVYAKETNYFSCC